MTRKDRRFAEMEAEYDPPPPPPRKRFHVITLLPGQTEDEARAAYDRDPIRDGDRVYFLEYVLGDERIDLHNPPPA